MTTYGWFGFYLPPEEEAYTLEMNRHGIDVVVHLVVEEFRNVIVPYTDPLPRQILGAIGLLVAVCGFWEASRIDL
ncbi:MAG: hypothetical protein ACE5H4_16075 [Candidatus Thorarchaeota archaeon]